MAAVTKIVHEHSLRQVKVDGLQHVTSSCRKSASALLIKYARSDAAVRSSNEQFFFVLSCSADYSYAIADMCGIYLGYLWYSILS